MTKVKAVWIGVVGSAVGFLITGSTMLTFWCGVGNYSCWKYFDFPGTVSWLFIPILFLSLITYFLQEEVFRAWLHFAYWWIPLSLVMIYLAAGTSGGGFGMPNVFDQEFVSMIFASLFAIISLILILTKSLLLRGK